MAGIGVFVTRHGALDPLGAAMIGLVFFALSLAALVVFRRYALSNAFNRQLTAFGIVATSMLVVDRFVSLVTDIPVQETLQRELVFLAALSGFGGLTITRSLLDVPLFFLAGLMLSLVYPTKTPALFSLSVIAALGRVAYLWGTAKRSKLPPE